MTLVTRGVICRVFLALSKFRGVIVCSFMYAPRLTNLALTYLALRDLT